MRMTLLAGHHQGGASLFVLGISLGSRFQYDHDGLGVTGTGRQHQGGLSLMVLGPYLGALTEEDLYRLQATS